MEKKVHKTTTQRQFEEMVDFLAQNPIVAKGMKYAEICNIHREDYEEKWEQLKEKLNKLGPPVRTVGSWQKVWCDYKLKIKKKLDHNKRQSLSTRAGKYHWKQLSSLQEEVVTLLSWETSLPQNSSVFGIDESSGQQTIDDQKLKEEDSASNITSSSISIRKRKRPADDYRRDLLTIQTDCMKRIPELLEMTNKHLEEISNIMEKNFKMQETKRDLRMEIMRLKKRKLQLEIEMHE